VKIEVEIEDLQAVLDYLQDDEWTDWVEKARPDAHIWRHLVNIADAISTQSVG